MRLGAPIMSAERLADLLGEGAEPEIVLCDVRWYLDARSGRGAYLEGHLPGAVWIDLDSVLAGAPSPMVGRHPLPEPDVFAEGLARAGIGDGTPVVAYDDQGGTAAARLVWLLRALGDDAALLDSGLRAWDGPLERGDVRRPRAQRTPHPWPAELVVDADDVEHAIATGTALVLDARTRERFRGEHEPIDPRAGHVPGARSAPYIGNLDETTGRFLDAGSLGRRYRALGVAEDRDVIVYCGSGVTACHDLLALEAAGHPRSRTRLYAGSWSQWSADPTREVATGDEE